MPLTADAAERKRIRRMLDDAGLELSAVCGHATQLDPDPEKRAANAERIRATIDLAADLAGQKGAVRRLDGLRHAGDLRARSCA